MFQMFLREIGGVMSFRNNNNWRSVSTSGGSPRCGDLIIEKGINLNWRINMKRIVITGIILVLVMFAVTCEAGFPNEEDVEYTDVIYSEDGSQITLYLDGVGVPVPASQRAMTRRLAMMAYDFLEVVFVDSSNTYIARTSWEIGQAAGISGVYRGVNGAGESYASVENACIFVGVKAGKTLLGVGKLTAVNNAVGTTIDVDTKSVVFTVNAIVTGLLVAGEVAGDLPEPAFYGSFDFDDANDIMVGTTAYDYSQLTTKNSSRFSLGNTQYPMYSLPEKRGQKVKANYTFTFVEDSATPGTNDYIDGIKHFDPDVAKPLVQPRVPRYMDNGRYLQPRAYLDTDSYVDLVSSYATPSKGDTFNPVVPLEFTVQVLGGIFSFNIEIPVYNVTMTPGDATNGGPDAEKWYIRTGFGSEFFSLDNGRSSGGCVLMGVGVTSLDWIEIEVEFLDY
jgi:hypothetical protein